MDYEAVFKRLGATLNLEKQAWVVVPLNSTTIREQIEDFLSKEYDLYVNELKSIEVGKDPEQASTDVVFEEGGANKVDEKKRGRKIKNIRVGPISCSFKLPPFCYDPKETDDIEKILSTLPKGHDEEKDGDITPLESRRFFVADRANNWTLEISKRDNNRIQDVYSTHIPSNRKFRSKLGVIQFILHESSKTKSEKRKSAKPTSGSRLN